MEVGPVVRTVRNIEEMCSQSSGENICDVVSFREESLQQDMRGKLGLDLVERC